VVSQRHDDSTTTREIQLSRERPTEKQRLAPRVHHAPTSPKPTQPNQPNQTRRRTLLVSF
jgi:hypothetical protein